MNVTSSLATGWQRLANRVSEFAKTTDAQALAMVVAVDAFVAGIALGICHAGVPNAHWSLFPHAAATSVDIAVGCSVAAAGLLACMGLPTRAARKA